MEGIKEMLHDSALATTEECDKILAELEFYKTYFLTSSNSSCSSDKTPQFYEHRFICCLRKIPPEPTTSVKEAIQEICISLMKIMASDSVQLYELLLSSTAFCSSLPIILPSSAVEDKFYEYLSSSGSMHLNFTSNCFSIEAKNVEVFKLCLCHGILQSNSLVKILPESQDKNAIPLAMFSILEESCMKYSPFTNTTFKVLVTLINKVYIDLKLSATGNILNRIFNIVMSNWESPLKGVEEQNKKIFGLLLDLCSYSSFQQSDQDGSDTVCKNITDLMPYIMKMSWKMKSKYVMLSLLLPRYGVWKAFDFPELLNDLILSLSDSHLSSAGSELYQICVNDLSWIRWQNLFMTPFLNILMSPLSIKIQNIINYWIPITLKKFPSLLKILLENMEKAKKNVDDFIFSQISLIKLGRKGGLFLNLWDKDDCLVFKKIVNLALLHHSEFVRAEAFAVLCCSTKTKYVPSSKEFNKIRDFLKNNIIEDSAFLRENILNSFAVFLMRLLDSGVHDLILKETNDTVQDENSKSLKSEIDRKTYKLDYTHSYIYGSGILQIIEFLECLYYFLESNFEPGVNYQRKILSLKLYRMVLLYFGGASDKVSKDGCVRRKGALQGNAKRIVEYALEINRWHFVSERSRKILLSCILDTTDDIREISGSILTEYFCLPEESLSECNPLLNYALKLCSSPMFYKTDSGALLLKVVCNWMYKMPQNLSDDMMSNITEAKQNTSAPLTVYLLSKAEAQFEHLKRDIFQAASSGSPLHGMLTGLACLAIEVDSPEYGLMSTEEVNSTVVLLQTIVSYLLDLLAAKSASDVGVAPSFAEMDEAIKSSIQESTSYLASGDEDSMQLSPAHQLVQNCVWLNLKMSCALASGLACNKTCSDEAVRHCGEIMIQVLTRCRHKGAIESAGVALSKFVKTVSSCHTSDKNVMIMLGDLLKEVIESLKSGTSSKGSVTRSSAGLSILVQKIITSDTRPGKPLLHMCVSQLLDIAKIPVEVDSKITSDSKPVLTDLPQAKAMHFLRILVQDSSLRQDIAQHMSAVAVICFTNFNSPVWTIRNAALQLSGALIPKLVGQKNIQDEDDTMGTCISAEEFFGHFPELTDFMLISLQQAANCQNSESLKLHASVIPVLSVLARVSVGIESFICTTLAEKINKYCVCILQLLSSPIYHVRKLAAKTYERLVPIDNTFLAVETLINNLGIHTKNDLCHFEENKVNGLLLALKYLLIKLQNGHENKMEIINSLLDKAINNEIFENNFTYFNQMFLIELIEDNNLALESRYLTHNRLMDVLSTLEKEKNHPSFIPGLQLWAAKIINIIIMKCKEKELVETWNNVFMHFNAYSDIIRSAFETLRGRLQNDKKIESTTKSNLFASLLNVSCSISLEDSYNVLFPLLDTMLLLIPDRNIQIFVSLKNVQDIASRYLNTKTDRSHHSMIALPVVSELLYHCFLHVQHHSEFCMSILKLMDELTNYVKDRSDSSEYNEDFRLNAAKSIAFLKDLFSSFVFKHLKSGNESIRRRSKPSRGCKVMEGKKGEEILQNIIETLYDAQICFLQDEDQFVRKEVAEKISFTNYFEDMTVKVTPYMSLQELLKPRSSQTARALVFFWKKLYYCDEFPLILSKHVNEDYEVSSLTSPFDHGTSNIYCEEIKMVDMYGQSLLDMVNSASTIEKMELSKEHKKLISLRDDSLTILSIMDKIETCGISSTSSGHVRAYIIAKKIMYLLEVTKALKVDEFCDINSIVQKLKQVLNFRTD